MGPYDIIRILYNGCCALFNEMKCACCGGDMQPENDIGNSVVYRCADCGISDTRLKEKDTK